MKTTKKIVSLVLAFVMIFSVCSAFHAYAAPKITAVKVVSVPDKLKFFKGTDWDYGEWDQPDDAGPWVWKSGSRISFLRNPGGGFYPDAGMIDGNGLVVEVSYSDGSKKNISYTETVSKGIVSQNIILSPENGAYKTGKMKVEVWFTENYNAYDTYEIEIIDRMLGDINGDNKINSSDALSILQYAVGTLSFSTVQKDCADMNSDGKYNSSDALLVLQKSVGLA